MEGENKMSTNKLIAIIGGIVVALAGLSIGAYFLFRPKDESDGDDDKDTDSGDDASGLGGLLNNLSTESYDTEGDQVYTGEASNIIYIAPENSAGKIVSSDRIEVRVGDGIFADGDVVEMKHKRYNDYFEIAKAIETGDGGYWLIVDTPYISSGFTNAAGIPQDNATGGTIAVVADTELSFAATGGKKIRYKKSKNPVKLKFKNKRWLKKSQALTRKQRKASGKIQGLKGKALRKFIRTKK